MKLVRMMAIRKLAKDRAFHSVPDKLVGWVPFVSKHPPCVQNGRSDNTAAQVNLKHGNGQWAWVSGTGSTWLCLETQAHLQSNSRTATGDKASCPFCGYFWLMNDYIKRGNVGSFGSSKWATTKAKGGAAQVGSIHLTSAWSWMRDVSTTNQRVSPGAGEMAWRLLLLQVSEFCSQHPHQAHSRETSTLFWPLQATSHKCTHIFHQQTHT